MVDKTGLYIIADDREHKVIPYFKQLCKPSEYEVIRMVAGDYAIMYRGYIVCIIERKTWRDLAGSIKDGRKKNINNLLNVREQTGAHIIYIMEGKPFAKANKRISGIRASALRSHLDHIALRDGITIIYTKDQENTVTRLQELCKNYGTLKTSRIKELNAILDQAQVDTPDNTDGDTTDTSSTKQDEDSKTVAGGKELLLLTTKKEHTDLHYVYEMWSAIPQITYKTASLFIDAKYKIADLCKGNISIEDISVLRYQNGSIVGKRASKILQTAKPTLVTSKRTYAKILSQVPGISLVSAKYLLQQIDFIDLLNGKHTELSEYKKTEKTKVGKKLASSIKKYLAM
jgi:ERCC4-type nuclease